MPVSAQPSTRCTAHTDAAPCVHHPQKGASVSGLVHLSGKIAPRLGGCTERVFPHGRRSVDCRYRRWGSCQSNPYRTPCTAKAQRGAAAPRRRDDAVGSTPAQIDPILAATVRTVVCETLYMFTGKVSHSARHIFAFHPTGQVSRVRFCVHILTIFAKFLYNVP